MLGLVLFSIAMCLPRVGNEMMKEGHNEAPRDNPRPGLEQEGQSRGQIQRTNFERDLNSVPHWIPSLR